MTDTTHDTATDNTDPGGTLVLTAEHRDHLIKVIESDNRAMESMIRTENIRRNASVLDDLTHRLETNKVILAQLQDPTALAA